MTSKVYKSLGETYFIVSTSLRLFGLLEVKEGDDSLSQYETIQVTIFYIGLWRPQTHKSRSYQLCIL